MKSWREQEIRSLGRVVTGKTPPTEINDYWGGEEQFVSPKDMERDSCYIHRTQATITQKALEKFKNQALPPNAVMYTSLSYGFGKIGLAKKTLLTNQQISSIIVNSSNDFRFVYYLLRVSTPYIFAYNSGIDTPIVPKSVFEKIKLSIPPFPIQRKIAAVLSTYDDLIENNNRRIAILEKSAEELYREWFVRLRFPGHEKVKITKGVPNGWNIQPLLDYAQFEKGFEPGAHDYYEDQGPDTVPFIRVGDMSTGRSSVYIANSYSQPMLTESDMAMSFDGTVGIVKVGFTGYFSSGIRKVLLCDVLPRPYVYQLLKSDAIQNVISQHATGSTILHAGSAINYFKFIKPPSDVLSDYSILASPILNHIGCLNKQIGIYSSSRDRLLSRLMSGKIDVEKMDIRFPESMKEEGVAHA